MILVASQRSGAVALADHLMNTRDNDHVELIELDGFIADDLHGALKETHAISKATRCKQFLFSVSLNPPETEIASDEDFKDAADRVAKAVGLEGQPRAIVVHEKEGRRHAHAVWSRIDVDQMKAVPLPHFKNKLRDVSRNLFLDHGWVLPNGLATYGNKNPLNFTLEEWQQAKRQGVDPREIKQVFQEAWNRSDSQSSFKAALEERGYYLARGDRRGFVALDINGKPYAINKWTGLKAKAVKENLGSADELPSVSEIHKLIQSKTSDHMRQFIANAKTRHTDEMRPLQREIATLVEAHRQERQALKAGQEKRWIQETKERSNRLRRGLRGLFDKFTGKSAETKQQNEREALMAAKRDQRQRDFMVKEQMKERRAFQERLLKLRIKHRTERKTLARDISSVLRPKISPEKLRKHHQTVTKSAEQRPRHDRGPSLTP